jgi:uroporphyrinogen decarboxylase
MEEFRRRTESDNPAEYFGIETRHVGFHLPEEIPDRTRWQRPLPSEAQMVDPIYGRMTVPAHFYHFWGYVFPLRCAETVRDIEAYPFADITRPECHRHLEAEVARWHEQGFFVDGFAGHIYETAWQLIGLDKMLESMVTNPALVEALLERITEHACFRARRLAEAGVDMLRTGDDVGMQTGMMMHPDLWRRFLKPRLRRVIEAARSVRPDLPVWYHSDGHILPIVDDLIEVGVTVLNPVQPECLDVMEVKRRYGDQLAFWGTIGTQSVMPFGTPEDVRREVKRMIDLFAPGLVLAPTHVLEPDVPWENIVAFFEAVEEFGSYV